MRRIPLLILALALLTAPIASAAEGSLQSEGRGRAAPDRRVDVLHLALDLRLDPAGGSVSGTATLTATPLRPGLRSLLFHQVGLAFERVTVDGLETTWRTGEEVVTVDLPAETALDRPLTIAFTYSARPTTGLHFRRPGKGSPDTYLEVWSQGEAEDNRHWIPGWDHPGDRMTYTGRFTAPEDLTVLSNGVLQASGAADPGWKSWEFALTEQDLVHYLVMVAAAPYRVFEDAWQGRPLRYYVPPDVDEATARRTLGRTPQMLDFMSELTGVPYPYPSYSQVMVQRFIYGGMENTTATVMDRGLLVPAHTAQTRTWSESVVAHELAHQWFGDQLTCRDWSEMWLNEGLTTWMAREWTRQSRGEDAWAASLHGTIRGLVGAGNKNPNPMVARFYNRRGDRDSAHVYTKGSVVMHMLRVLLGEEAFRRGLTTYLLRHQHGLVESDDLRRAMEDASGLHLRWFFDQWVTLAGHPELAVTHKVDREQGRVVVQIRQTQKPEGLVPSFTLPVDIELGTDAGVHTERVWLEEGSARASLPLSGELRWVAVDPAGGLLADIDHTQTPDEWLAMLRGSPHAYARRSALWNLSELEGAVPDAVRDALGALLRDTSAATELRQGAAEALGAWADDASAAVLSSFATDRAFASQPSLLRKSVAAALGKSRGAPDRLQALDRVFRRDEDEFVRAEALQSLTQVLEAGVRDRAREALRSGPNDAWTLQQTAADALGKWGRPEDLEALARFRAADAPTPRLLHQAVWASVRLAQRAEPGRAREEARRRLAREVEPLLLSLHLRDRQTALRALGEVGDAGSVPAIQALLRTENDAGTRETARAALEAIRKHREDDAETPSGELKARLEGLQERIDALEKQVRERLERY